jgi:hypothetical protein
MIQIYHPLHCEALQLVEALAGNKLRKFSKYNPNQRGKPIIGETSPLFVLSTLNVTLSGSLCGFESIFVESSPKAHISKY